MFYDLWMATYSTDIKKILKENVEALMRSRYGKENYWKLCQECGIGPGTGTRIKEAETSVGIEILEKLAKLFEIHPWHLLIPSLEPSNPPVVLISDVEQEFYEKMKAASSILAGSKIDVAQLNIDANENDIVTESGKANTNNPHETSGDIKKKLGIVKEVVREGESKASKNHKQGNG